MIAPALPRWMATTLAHESYGVNALLPSVPRPVDEAAPPECAIFNAVDDNWVARGRIDDEATPDQWVLAVRIAEETDIAGQPAASSYPAHYHHEVERRRNF